MIMIIMCSLTYSPGRCDKLLAYIRDRTGNDYEAFMRTLMTRPEVTGLVSIGRTVTPEQAAMLVVGGNLTNAQWEHLCKSRCLADASLKSMRVVNEGLQELEKLLPPLGYLVPDAGNPAVSKFCGCAYDPEKYIGMILQETVDDLDLQGEFSKTIVAALADDGASEGKTVEYPMLLETLNFVQDGACQSLLKCHVLALARCSESHANEMAQFDAYHSKFSAITKWGDYDLVFVYVADGSDLSKKMGLGGQQAHCPCTRCFAIRTPVNAKEPVDHCQMLSWLPEHATCLPYVKKLREYERTECKRAGRCVCGGFCAKELARLQLAADPDRHIENMSKKFQSKHTKATKQAGDEFKGQVNYCITSRP